MMRQGTETKCVGNTSILPHSSRQRKGNSQSRDGWNSESQKARSRQIHQQMVCPGPTLQFSDACERTVNAVTFVDGR
jgi:hypothetical protein